MNADKYQELAARTLLDEPGFELTELELQLLTDSLQMAIAASSVVEFLKKAILHRHGLGPSMIFATAGTLGAVGFWAGQLESDLETHMTNRQQGITSPPQKSRSGKEIMKLWNAVGLVGEDGEVARLVLKSFDCEGDEVIEELEEELGDSEWYTAGIATKFGISLGDAMAGNIEKLMKRYPDGFTAEDSIRRQDKAE